MQEISNKIDWLIDWILFLNGEDISTKADSYICHCYNTTNNQDIHSEILLQKDIDKYSISKNKNNNKIITTTTHVKPDSDCNRNEKIAVKNNWSEKV